MDNNEGFVAPAVAYCQAELHEEFTMAISALDDAKDSFKSLTKLVPEGSEIHQALVLINMQIKTAHSLSKSANITMGTADVTAGRSKSSSIPLAPGQQLLMPRKKRKVSATQSVPTAGGDSESHQNVTTQEVDPQGGEFQNSY